MKTTKASMIESEIAALIEYEIKKAKAYGFAYVPVVATGSNALVLHYVKNRHLLK